MELYTLHDARVSAHLLKVKCLKLDVRANVSVHWSITVPESKPIHQSRSAGNVSDSPLCKYPGKFLVRVRILELEIARILTSPNKISS